MEDLFGYERQYVIDAVRRDMKAEAQAAETDPQWREWHLENTRRAVQVLDALNPKRTVWH